MHGRVQVTKDSIAKSMYNKVVRVINNKHKFDYYYVLHYILDMDWCHLVPMHAKTTFGGESFRAGRPRYKLVPEGEGRELDVPAARCRQVGRVASQRVLCSVRCVRFWIRLFSGSSCEPESTPAGRESTRRVVAHGGGRCRHTR